MGQDIKKAPAAKPAAAAKPKLVPRTAPKTTAKATAKPTTAPVAAPVPAPEKAAAPASKAAAPRTAATARAKPVRRATQVEETVAKHQKVLADALVKAQAINYDQPKAAKPVKPRKVKLVRDSYAMPDTEYAQIGALKKRMATLGNEVKKSELLRGGIAALVALNDAELKTVMGRIERIKTGRPAK